YPRVTGHDPLHTQAGQQSVHIVLTADGWPMVDARNRRTEAAMRFIAQRLAAARARARETDQVGERDFELRDELHDAPNDLPGEILKALGEQNLGEVAAHRVHILARSIEEDVHALDHSLELVDRDAARAEALPQLHDIGGFARGTLCKRRGLLDEIERTMCGFVGELEHVIESMPRVGHLFFREREQSRVQLESIERGLQIARQLAQLAE